VYSYLVFWNLAVRKIKELSALKKQFWNEFVSSLFVIYRCHTSCFYSE
jgi:hypothetical protein